MKELVEQWIEVINGQEHMVKEVSALSYGDCNGCFLFTVAGCGKVTDFAPCSSDTIIKDLGILNDDGLLPCPFCGEYPVVENAYEGCGYTPPDGYWRVYCSNDNHEISVSSGKRRQESIDAWNRRV